jgi:hypothetical protein
LEVFAFVSLPAISTGFHSFILNWEFQSIRPDSYSEADNPVSLCCTSVFPRVCGLRSALQTANLLEIAPCDRDSCLNPRYWRWRQNICLEPCCLLLVFLWIRIYIGLPRYSYTAIGISHSFKFLSCRSFSIVGVLHSNP